MSSSKNPLLLLDVYKMGHMEMYAPGTTEVYSYLEARKPNERIIFFGLQYILKEYLSIPITKAHADEFIKYYQRMLGICPQSTQDKIYALAALGYWPVTIKAVAEGSVIETKNALMSIKNTLPEFYWCVGFLESLLLKLWNPCTVAACSLKYKDLVTKYGKMTCDDLSHIMFQVHDFGYRGVSSEETAEISGAAHLLSFYGSDTVPAVVMLDKVYNPALSTIIGLSVPASEHSVMCSYGRDGEFEAFDNLLAKYPTGIVSIVSDTYDFWNVMTNYTHSRRDVILARDGKVVFRPDSGNPVHIVCGNPEAPEGTPERKGALQLLWDEFGGTTNSKGYKVINPKVGLIYGDGMFYERFELMLETMKENGFASSNLVIGVGGLLLQQHNRDEFGFAIKATRTIRNGQSIEIYKDPITDTSKKSKRGLMHLHKVNGKYYTTDQCDEKHEARGCLETVYTDGHILKEFTLEQVRENIDKDVLATHLMTL